MLSGLLGALFFWLTVVQGADAQALKIVTFGDSGPAGSGVSSSAAYPAQLRAMLKAKGINATVQNISVPGDTTAMGLARVSSVPKDAMIVITEFGSNDLRANVSRPQMNASMDAIVKRLRANGAKVLIMGTRGIDYSEVAARNGAAAITYPPSFRQYIQPTGKHLTAEGHRAAAAIMLPQVMTMLGQSGK